MDKRLYLRFLFTGIICIVDDELTTFPTQSGRANRAALHPVLGVRVGVVEVWVWMVDIRFGSAKIAFFLNSNLSLMCFFRCGSATGGIPKKHRQTVTRKHYLQLRRNLVAL